MSAQIFTDGRGQERACTIINDVTRRVQMEAELLEITERLRNLAVTDELTGLHNRRGFDTVARHVLEIASRQRITVAMLFVDVDDLKAINDRHGHDAGDHAIRTVAAALRQELRSADTIARIGGDEFAALALGLQDAELDSIRQRIATHLQHAQTAAGIGVAVSIGWTVHPADAALTLEQLLADADQAMYLAKTTMKQARLRAPDGPGDAA